ncbi:unnamed protein product [Dibothriocephalus latus]|uniref:DNA polymerase delta catalytic subunit n=1 Tax=Dibothriocephalus latus TaxID=60516 RepID=A0A3P7P9X2_DIBLA|nr:unnamed protein product [Dibothriocephalus latus]
MEVDEEDEVGTALVDGHDTLAIENKLVKPRSWARPPVQKIPAVNDKIVFQQIDVDFYEVLHSRWTAFVREVDPDIITGYNMQQFDLPYLTSRCEHLQVESFPFLGRIVDSKSVVRESMVQSKQMGR